MSQPYVSLLENGHRALSEHMISQLSAWSDVQPTLLPIRDPARWMGVADVNDQLAKHLAALGYPGFSYLRTRLRRNPAEVLVGALLQSNLEVRVTEGLPWLVLTYSDLDWEWVLRQVKVHDAQNRLGFLVSLARELATRRGDFTTACGLAAVETRLERSRLEHEDTFCHESLTNVEREWLREHRPEQAGRWHLLTDLSPEHLSHVS